MDNTKNRHNDHLGVNKIGKNIRKSPLHQPNFANSTPNRQQPQPQVYNISKNDFRNIVQQLTGSPSQEPLPRPPQNPPKPQSQRLQRIRPPPLTPINRPHIPPPVPVPVPVPPPGPAPAGMAPPPVPYNNLVRPPQFGQPSPTMLQPSTPGDQLWGNIAESPISAYMRYLQNSMMDPGSRGNQPYPQPQFQPQPHPQSQIPGHAPPQPPTSGLLPNPNMSTFPSPRMNNPMPPVPNLPSPRMNGPALLPSPTSQFLLPSPSGYMNLLSPRSPYALLSPGVQFPPPLMPNFAFSPMAQSGILGPGPQAPPSPGIMFPMSPSGFFPISSPRWRDH